MTKRLKGSKPNENFQRPINETMVGGEYPHNTGYQKPQQKTGCTIGCGSICITIILIALACVAVKECKRADIRLEKAKQEAAIYDSIHAKTR